MRITMLLSCFLLLGLSACAQPTVVSADPTKPETYDIENPLGEKCKDAKFQLDKTVEGGQLTDLKELKRNIELYCVWRRN
jgi:hypothetical protein